MQCMHTQREGQRVKMVWPALWQRFSLAVLILLNAWESYVLFRQRSFLGLLNGAIALFLLVVLVLSWPRKQRDQR
jgi:hypothetical protein